MGLTGYWALESWFLRRKDWHNVRLGGPSWGIAVGISKCTKAVVTLDMQSPEKRVSGMDLRTRQGRRQQRRPHSRTQGELWDDLFHICKFTYSFSFHDRRLCWSQGSDPLLLSTIAYVNWFLVLAFASWSRSSNLEAFKLRKVNIPIYERTSDAAIMSLNPDYLHARPYGRNTASTGLPFLPHS